MLSAMQFEIVKLWSERN